MLDGTTRIMANVVSHNDGDGIAVVDRGFLFFPYLIADNVANDNGGFGISFTGVAVGPNGETVDGGGNSARHNAAERHECAVRSATSSGRSGCDFWVHEWQARVGNRGTAVIVRCPATRVRVDAALVSAVIADLVETRPIV